MTNLIIKIKAREKG